MRITNLNVMLKDMMGGDTTRSLREMFMEMLAVAEVKTRAEARQCDDISKRLQNTEESIEISSAESDVVKSILESMLSKGIMKRFVFSQLDNSIVE